MKRILYTAFTGFGSFRVNPSARVLRHVRERMGGTVDCSVDYRLCRVSYRCARELVRGLGDEYDLVLLTGVASREAQLRVELCARNRRRGRDVDGVGTSALRPIRPGTGDLKTNVPLKTLESIVRRHKCDCRLSRDAGNYLCNYIYYQALSRFRGRRTRVLFVHIADPAAPGSPPSIPRQADLIRHLMALAKPSRCGGQGGAHT